MTKRAALILAGGRAHRFQHRQEKWQDKALAELSGKPLLLHAVANAQKSVDRIVVCVNDEARKAQYTEILAKHNIKDISIVADEKISHISGPNVAILTGLKAAEADYCLTLPCDMPLMKPQIIDYLFSAAEDAQVVVPMWPNGRLETLVMVLEGKSALEITETLCQLRRPRSDDIIRGASKVHFVSPMNKIKALDPELKSFVNINRSEDLVKMQTRQAHGPITENMQVNLGALLVPELQRLREAATRCSKREFQITSETFASCALNLEKEKSFFWAGVSRENEAESLLAWSQQKNGTADATELDYKGRDAFVAAVNDYRLEAEMHEENHCRFLAERAWADKAWCESWSMGKTGHIERYPLKF